MQLPFLRANKEGKVCFSAVEQIKTVLKYFTEICQGEVLGASPSLAVTEMEVEKSHLRSNIMLHLISF